MSDNPVPFCKFLDSPHSTPSSYTRTGAQREWVLVCLCTGPVRITAWIYSSFQITQQQTPLVFTTRNYGYFSSHLYNPRLGVWCGAVTLCFSQEASAAEICLRIKKKKQKQTKQKNPQYLVIIEGFISRSRNWGSWCISFSVDLIKYGEIPWKWGWSGICLLGSKGTHKIIFGIGWIREMSPSSAPALLPWVASKTQGPETRDSKQ